jgi:hypothetical protein
MVCRGLSHNVAKGDGKSVSCISVITASKKSLEEI